MRRRCHRWLATLSVTLVSALTLAGATAVRADTVPLPIPSPSPIDSPSPVPSSGPCVRPADVTPPSDPEGASAVQDEIHAVGSQILGLQDQNAYPGFTGLIGDPDNARLLLCWLHDDPLPDPIAAIVATPGQPIAVLREDTPYSYGQLAPLVDPIFANGSLEAQISASIDTVTVPEEGTGLIVGVNPDDTGSFDLAQAGSVLSAAAGVPVSVQTGAPPVPTASRKRDSSPWYGGARVGNAAYPTCSTGFGMTLRSRPYMLTANHCGRGSFFNNLQLVGTVTTSDLVRYDSEAIPVASPNTAGRKIYTGGVDVSEGRAWVDGVGRNIVDDWVNTSGSASGEHSGLRIVDTNEFIKGADLGLNTLDVGPLVKATRIGAGVAVARGDSGGPVYQVSVDKEVLGMGTISAMYGESPCSYFDASRCGRSVAYADLSTLLRLYEGSLP